MEVLTGLFLILFLVWFINRKGQDSKPATNKAKNKINYSGKTACEIADSITTLKEFKALYNKMDKAQEKMYDAVSDSAQDRAQEQFYVLEEAVKIATFKTYHWQFVPPFALDTPSNFLEHAYKLYSSEEYLELRKSLSSDKNNWQRVDGTCELDGLCEPEACLRPLLQFRKIVESDNPKEKKIKKINQLVEKNRSTLSGLFDYKSNLPPGDQWYALQLSEDGLPSASELYAEGYTTAEKCLEISEADFAQRKGVGPKKIEQLKQYQAKVKSRLGIVTEVS